MATVRLVLTKPINASLQAKTLDTGAWDVIYFTRIENGKQVGDIERLGKCVNIETAAGDYYSEELWDGVDGDDANWTAHGNNTMAEDDNAVRVTYVDNGDGAYIQFRDSKDLNTDLTVGATYRCTANVKTNTGSIQLSIRHGSSNTNSAVVGSTDYVNREMIFVSQHFQHDRLEFNAMSSGEIGWVKNISLKQVVTVSSNQYLVDIEVDDTAQTPSDGDFIFFGKENKVNISGVRGYFSEVKMNNDSNGPAKLFSVGSEIAQSSK